jgi:hypothetical protein
MRFGTKDKPKKIEIPEPTCPQNGKDSSTKEILFEKDNTPSTSPQKEKNSSIEKTKDNTLSTSLQNKKGSLTKEVLLEKDNRLFEFPLYIDMTEYVKPV